MTPYTMLHLALAGAFLVLALVHFVTWAAVRSQRVQLWLAESFLGFALISFTTGITSREASEMIADTRPWLLLGVLPSIPLPYTLLRVAWSLLDQPLTLWRRVMLGVALALGAVRVLDVSWSILTLPATGLTAEALSRATAGLSLPLFWLLATCVAGTWAVEAARLLNRRGAMAAAVLAASLCALALLCRAARHRRGLAPGASALRARGTLLPAVRLHRARDPHRSLAPRGGPGNRHPPLPPAHPARTRRHG
ncbi:hypothetical protein ACN28I_43920 [Archangium gephyra]|uniref:hypothetical protein n=1 Tax=Archangium gephyra TaxID=48 RepID=UPI003B760B8D